MEPGEDIVEMVCAYSRGLVIYVTGIPCDLSRSWAEPSRY